MSPHLALSGYGPLPERPLPGMSHYQPLLAYARQPDDPGTQACASAIEIARSSTRMAGRSRLGLDSTAWLALLDQYFPGCPASYRGSTGANRNDGSDEFDDLVSLLMQHRLAGNPESVWLAHAIAAGCMGDDHLWQDLGLANRQALSRLLATWFPGLYATNTAGMRWKKFFYRQLCLQSGVKVCRSPTCEACSEYTHCFGPEED